MSILNPSKMGANSWGWMFVTPTRAAGWVALILFIILMIYYSIPRDRSFFLDVVTDYVQVTTDHDTQIVWDIAEAHLCQPRHKLSGDPPKAQLKGNEPLCDGTIYHETLVANVELDWPQGVTLALRRTPKQPLDIVILHDEKRKLEIGGEPVVSESLLRFRQDAFDATGGFGLSGDVVIGQKAEHGTIALLRSGRFETLEKPYWRNEVYLVDEGTLSLGDVVSIEPDKGDDSSSTYVFVTTEPNVKHLRVVAVSGEGRNRLALSRATANKVYLEPSWTERLARDPFILAIGTLMAFIPAVFGAISAFLDKGKEKPEQDNETSGPDATATNVESSDVEDAVSPKTPRAKPETATVSPDAATNT